MRLMMLLLAARVYLCGCQAILINACLQCCCCSAGQLLWSWLTCRCARSILKLCHTASGIGQLVSTHFPCEIGSAEEEVQLCAQACHT